MKDPSPSLRSVSIKGDAAGSVFLANIRQEFFNDSGKNVEFIYTFPMPADASVCSFSAKTPRGSFKGGLESRDAALGQYQKAIAEGDGAFMLESHRDNIFQASLGNVGKGETAEANISYIQGLKVSGNEIRLAIPTLVGARYIPGTPVGAPQGGLHPPTNEVPDAHLITPERGNTEYKACIEIKLDLDSEIVSVSSPSHGIVTELINGKAAVRLKKPEKMDSDFVLDIVLGAKVQEKFLQASFNNEYFSYVSFAPDFISNAARKNKEYIFMVDVSGSMMGANLESAKRALKLCLRNMQDGDTFNIIAFESHFGIFSEKSVPYAPENFESANRWADALFARGGTEIGSALRYAVENAANPSEKESVIILLTDGQIGNEGALIEYAIKSYHGRIFTIGIDTNVNDSFLNKLSRAANGFAEYYYPNSEEDLDKKVVKQFLRCEAASMKDISWPDGCQFAGNPPALIFSGETCHLFFTSGKPVEMLDISGTVGEDTILLHFEPEAADGELLMKMWAKKAIANMELELASIHFRHEEAAKVKIAEISKKYGVLCRYTSFISFDERGDKFTQFPVAAPVPVEMPRGSFSVQALGLGAGPVKNSHLMAYEMPSASPRLMREKHSFFAPIARRSTSVNASPGALHSKPLPPTGIIQQADNVMAKSGEWTVLSLYEYMKNIKGTTTAFAEKELKKILLELKNIDYESDFFQMDWILSQANWHASEWLDRRAEILNGLKNASLSNYSASQIAAEQNMDGSFGHCEEIKKHLTALAVARMSADDPYVYGRQIEKALTWLGKAGLDGAGATQA